jgi:hypothetical protein
MREPISEKWDTAEEYRRLLRGEITSAQYVQAVRDMVRERRAERLAGTKQPFSCSYSKLPANDAN